MHIKQLLKTLMLTAGLLTISALNAQQTVFYPNKEDAIFSLTAPDSWFFSEPEDGVDYYTLSTQQGTVIYFRAIDGTEENSREFFNDSAEYLKSLYVEAILEAPVTETHHGNTVITTRGTGKDEDDTNYRIGLNMFILPTGSIAEIWFEANAEEHKEIQEIETILKSLQFHPIKSIDSENSVLQNPEENSESENQLTE